jgi:hypothetical protein
MKIAGIIKSGHAVISINNEGQIFHYERYKSSNKFKKFLKRIWRAI